MYRVFGQNHASRKALLKLSTFDVIHLEHKTLIFYRWDSGLLSSAYTEANRIQYETEKDALEDFNAACSLLSLPQKDKDQNI